MNVLMKEQAGPFVEKTGLMRQYRQQEERLHPTLVQGSLTKQPQESVDLESEKELCLTQLRKIHNQETMELENKVKSRDTKLLRLELELNTTRKLHSEAITRLEEAVYSLEQERIVLLEKLQKTRENDCQVVDEEQTLRTIDDGMLHRLQTENEALRLENLQVEVLRSTKTGLETTIAEMNSKIETLRRDLDEGKLRQTLQAVASTALQGRPPHGGEQNVKTSAPASSTATIPGKHVQRYPCVQFSREAFGMELELEDDEVVQDTPRHHSSQSSRKEKDREKRRRTLPEVVRNTQEQHEETLHSNVLVAQSSGLVVGRLRGERSTRSRSSSRVQGYKKRKST